MRSPSNVNHSAFPGYFLHASAAIRHDAPPDSRIESWHVEPPLSIRPPSLALLIALLIGTCFMPCSVTVGGRPHFLGSLAPHHEGGSKERGHLPLRRIRSTLHLSPVPMSCSSMVHGPPAWLSHSAVITGTICANSGRFAGSTSQHCIMSVANWAGVSFGIFGRSCLWQTRR